MTRIIRLLIVIPFLLLYPFASFAWNAIGHMVIANIAYQNIQPHTKNEIEKLIGYFHKEYSDINSFVQIVTWPDSIRSQKIEMFTHWHYIDKPFSKGKENEKLPNIIDEDNAVWALGQITKVVKNDRANNYERARFLAFFAHIVSDLHQPLHTVSYVSQAYPQGDKGGNLYQVRYQGDKTKLHHLWDNGVGLINGKDNVLSLTKTITTLYPRSFFGNKVNDLEPEHWLTEGMANAKNYVYAIQENQETDNAYIEKGQKIAQQEIALAGYRLAAMLDKVFT